MPRDGKADPPRPASSRLATSREVYHRIRWDPRLDVREFTLEYEERGAGLRVVPLLEFVPDGDIPWHRVWAVLHRGARVWDRKRRLDRLDEILGTAAAGELGEALALSAGGRIELLPFCWDAASQRWTEGALAPPALAPDAPLRVATYNVLWESARGDEVERIAEAVELLRELAADVLALQEVTPAFLRHLLAQPWARAYASSDSPRGSTLAPSGEVLLSRWPLERLAKLAFTAKKTALCAELSHPRAPLRVAVVHLTSNRAADAADARAAQLWTVLEALREGASADGAQLVLGDTNAAEHELDEWLEAYGLADAWRALHPDDPGFTYDPLSNPQAARTTLSGQPARYDRVLVGGGLAVRTATLAGRGAPARPPPSDHYAVTCELVWGTAPTPARAPAPTPRPSQLAAPVHRSALVVLPPRRLWPVFDELRARHDRTYARIPPHITLLYGFVPEELFDDATHLLAPIAARTPRLSLELAELLELPHPSSRTVALAVRCKPPRGLTSLCEELVRALPLCDEQSTRSAAGYTPHLTLGQLPAPRDERERRAQDDQLERWRRAWRPVSFEADAMVLLSRRDDGPFQERGRLPLGQRSPRRAAADEPPLQRELARACREALGQPCLLWPVGSTRLGLADADSDLDLLCVSVGRARDEVLPALARALAGALPAARVRVVDAAVVPLLELEHGGRLVDVSCAALPAGTATEGASAEQLARRWLTELPTLDEPSRLGLLAVLDAEVLLSHARRGPPERFSELARLLRRWAKARAVHGHALGYLGGISWAVLAARALVTAPADLPARALACRLLDELAAWDPARALGLPELGEPAAAPHATFTLLAPAPPARNTARNVTRATWAALRAEAGRAARLLDARADLAEILAPWHPGPEVVGALHLWPEDAADSGQVEGRLRGLLLDLERHCTPRPVPAPAGEAGVRVHLAPRGPSSAAALARRALEDAARLASAAPRTVRYRWQPAAPR